MHYQIRFRAPGPDGGRTSRAGSSGAAPRRRPSHTSVTGAGSSRWAAIWVRASARWPKWFARVGRDIALIGVDTARGSGPEGTHDTNAHGPAVEYGGGTFAGLLHRNVIACGAADLVQLLISDSVAAAQLFPDQSLAWVHIDARHDYASVSADIAAWAPKVRTWAAGCPETTSTPISGRVS